MANRQQKKYQLRARRHRRIRSRIVGTAARPRLTVFRSHQWMSAQIINDALGRTLVAIFERQEKLTGKPVERAKLLGVRFAERAKTFGIARVVFDRGGYAYHGRVAAFAQGARDGGLQF